ncbi:HotDog domain-containing protein [Amylocarpus encephaloides]|uniref:HotDog domain-containing protein n=1 Tax=Amylocarpus encephaloides TaxID=45428 RepID=A0A9P8C344_9HELO|nr:HotDog domain-containing protein [Amylocarpus encephaloides]
MADAKASPPVMPIPTGDDLSAEEKVKALIFANADEEMYTDGELGWGASLLLSHLTLLSATSSPPRTVFRFTVAASHCNRLNNLHGGCTSTLFDWLTTSALACIAKPGYWQYAGVSRTLNVTYLRPVPEGEVVLVESEVVHAGKRLCALKGTMRRERDGEVLAICEHGKVSIDPEVAKM